MDAVTPQTADTHSHLVRPDSMEWQKTRFPGCEAKTLLFDRKTGLMTALMRFAPGAVLPDHEHVNIEQTYVLEGSLVDKEGPAQGIECKAGEFIWREEGSRHVAWCPQGGLMLAIFQVPNKFFEADGRVIDAAGEDWDAAWGHTRKYSASLTQYDPRRRVIAGAFLAAHLAIDAGREQARRDRRAQQQMIEPQSGVARPAVALVVPEREHRF